MGLLIKAKAAIEAFRHPSRPLFASGLLRRTRFDYRREIGDCLDSSVVTAPVQFLQRSLPEARLAVQRRQRGGKKVDLLDHPMLALVQAPNPFYGDIALWFGTVLSYAIDGNAYWVKVRNGLGRPAELWYIPHWLIEPQPHQDGSGFLSHYKYSPGGVAPIRLEADDVVHFRHGINPRNLLKGLSPIDGVIREIFMDLESSNFVASLLRNMGVPGVIISPKGGAMPSPDDVAATKTWFQENYGGDQRGKPMVMGAPTEVSQFGFNPQELNMSEARDIAEERICACLGIPAAVVGFGAGLQQTKVGATMAELRKLAWHNGVLPMGRGLVGELKRSVLPDFGPVDGLDLYLNTDEVLALQEEEDAQEKRWNERLKTGGITVYDWRQGIGMEADDSHKIYLRPINLIEVPEGAAGRTAGDAPADPSKGRGEKHVLSKVEGARPSAEALKRGEAYGLMLERAEPGLRKAFAGSLTTLFGQMAAKGREVAAPLLAGEMPGKGAKADLRQAQDDRRGQKADDDIVAQAMALLNMPAWQAALEQTFNAHYLDIAKSVQDAAEQAGLGTNLPDPVARAIVATGGRRSGLIDLDQQTREAIYDALAEGRSEGEGVQQLADRISQHIEAGPWSTGEIRAQIIARTETKFAQNVSTIQRGIAAGVTSFIMFDGRFGLPRSSVEHIALNGTIIDAADAMTWAESEHPNGTRSFAPNFG